MKRILFTILILISLTGDSFSQRIPFAFWNRLDPDTLELDAPTLISPADDSTGIDQSPLLDWDGVIYATNYIVQLDNDTNFSPVSWTDTTVNSKAIVELGLVQGTTWYWRVLAFNLFDTSEWSVTYSFTVTTGPALTTPTLVLPRDDTTNVIQTPVLDWDTVINVRHYVVQLSDTISFTDIYWSDSLTQSTSTVDSVLSYASIWYWRVIAYNDFDTSAWSDIYTFTIQDPTIASPTLLTPADGATGQSQSPTLVWSETDNADFYNVQLTQYSDFSSVLWNRNTFDTSKLVDMTLLEGTKWYWRARAINATDTSNWSSTFAFIVTEGAATARTYYIDSVAGKDEYNGRSTTTPWQSLTKVNAMAFIAGDTILFKGGQTFAGGIRQRLTYDDTTQALLFGSYGTGKAKLKLGVADSFGVNINYTKHIKTRISNLIIEGVYDPATETGGANLQVGVYVWNWTLISPLDSNRISQVTVSNCEIHNIRSNGISIVPGDYGKTIRANIDSNTIYNMGGGGISMLYNWHGNSRIFGNTIYDVYGFNSEQWDKAISIILCKDVAIERNLIYNIGWNSSWSGIGIVTTASKNIRIRYNEIYNIVNNTHLDAQAINLENGTDSSTVEYNYVHDTRMGVLISSNSSFEAISGNYKAYADQRGSIDSGSADYNVVRYNLFKNIFHNSTDGFSVINMASGVNVPSIPGKNNQIYNNTIIFPRKPPTQTYAFKFIGRSDSTKIFNNLVIGDSIVFMLIDTFSTKTNSFVDNNMYWDKNKSYFYFWKSDPFVSYSFNEWSDSSGGWESSKLVYNPLLSNPYSSLGDTLNNPYLIETMLKYVPVYGSLTRDNGVELNSYTTSAPTTDMRGLPAYANGKYSIGAFCDTTTSSYTFQEEAKRWIGRMDTLQTAEQMKTKDSLIIFMKRDTLLSELDLFYIFANLDSTSAKLNIIRDTFNIVTSNNPVFTTQSGYTGNGTSAYLNTQWTPSLHGVKYTLNSANASVYSMTNISEDKSLLGTNNAGTAFIRITPNNSTNTFQGAINESGFMTTGNTTTIGLFSVNRSSVSATQIYKSDTLIHSATGTSTSLVSSPLLLLARNSNGTPAFFSTGKISAVTVGQSLNQYSNYRLTDNLEWYLNRTGTPKTSLKPILISPANNDTGVNVNATLYWNKINNKTSYHIQMSFYSDFSALIGEMTNVDTNAYFIGGSNPGSLGSVTLDSNQAVYWRVRGVNSAGNGTWSNISTFTTTTSYDPAAVALFTRFPYAVSVERKDMIDSLIKQLKADTVWEKIDIMYMFAADDTSNAKLNWKSTSYTCSLLGSTKPTFTANQGFAGNGSTAYINTTWASKSNGVNFVLDSASMFVYVRTSVTEDKVVIGSSDGSPDYLRINPRNTSGQIDGRINESLNTLLTTYNPIGLYSIIRTASNAYKIYKNDSVKATSTNVSTDRPVTTLYILANNTGGTAGLFSTRQVAFVMAGGKFTDYTQTVINRRIEWYLNRIGACVLAPSYVWLTSPANSATGVSISTDFDWENVGANYYQIEIDDDIAFGSPYYTGNTSGSEEINDNIGGFAAATTYYWRVRGVNIIGTGAWSSTYSFTTAP